MIDISNETREDRYYVIVAGEVDASSSIHLDNAISKAVNSGYKKIYVDCNELNYISSAGLGVFMSYIQEFEVQDIIFVIYGLNPKVKNVFQILGLDQLLTIVNSEEQAKEVTNGV
jgi:anti-sigma B factor antagonist